MKNYVHVDFSRKWLVSLNIVSRMLFLASLVFSSVSLDHVSSLGESTLALFLSYSASPFCPRVPLRS